MIRAAKYRIYPTKSQEQKILETLNLCKFLYNCALEHRSISYSSHKKSISYNIQANFLPEIKILFPEYLTIHSQVIQNVLKRLDKAFSNFFRRIKLGQIPGYPRFKNSDRYNSFTYPQSGFSLDKEKQKLSLFRIGHIKVVYHRELPKDAKIKTCSIKKIANKYYVIFTYECSNVKQTLEPNGKSVGIDLGIKTFATLSDGSKIDNPRFFSKYEKKKAKAQRRLSNKTFGSKARIQAKYHLNRIYEKIDNCKTDYLHKMANKIIKNYDIIIFEKLNIANMIENGDYRILRKEISNVSWAKFISIIVYKAEEAGRKVVFVNPRNTTKECSKCGFLVEKTLSERIHHCSNCGLKIDRDLNASIVIYNRGMEEIKKNSKNNLSVSEDFLEKSRDILFGKEPRSLAL